MITIKSITEFVNITLINCNGIEEGLKTVIYFLETILEKIEKDKK